MITTFGRLPDTMPEGYFKAVRFPVLAKLDEKTDYRIIDSAGFGTRDLPLTIRAQWNASYGHTGAEVSGAIFEVTVDPEAGVASGRGFLLDDPAGRRHALLIKTKAMKGNSVDLADVQARWEFNIDTGEETLRFTKANLAATTGVATPAFAAAHAVIDDEIVASLVGDDPMEELVASCDEHAVMLLTSIDDVEVVASAGQLVPFEAFYEPEAAVPTKIVVTEDGRVYGHLGVWDTCHVGIEGRCVIPPRPKDGYASYNQAGPLTTRGQVETGPVFLLGGHPRKPLGKNDPWAAYGGVENCWADLRITEGRIGPWVSGLVRPGVDEDMLYAARASRISGHWVGDQLMAIVSCNVPGFLVPGSGLSADADGFALGADGEVLEMVASFPACLDTGASQAAGPITAEEVDARIEAALKFWTGNKVEANAEPATEAAAEPAQFTDDDDLLLELDLDD